MTIEGYRLEVFYWLCLIILASPGSDRDAPIERSYACQYVDTPINIDGRLTDEQWYNAVKASEFTNIENCDRVALQTSFRSFFDSTYLYFGVVAHDPHIVASITKDNMPLYKYDPTIELFLDPGGDGRDYYELQVNALNSTWQLSFDQPLKQGGRATNPAVIDGLLSQTYVSGSLNDGSDTDQYWSVELAIPWSALSALGDREALLSQLWKINLGRVYHHVDGQNSPQFWAWSCANALDMHLPATWGSMNFEW